MQNYSTSFLSISAPLLSSKDKHSRYSPFNTDSDLFPNGILSENWFLKYQQLKPFAFVQTMELPDVATRDDEIAAEMTELKSGFDAAGIKFVVILISKSTNSSEDEIRINRFRQLTNLTKATGLLYLNCVSKEYSSEVDVFVTSLVSNLKSSAVDFYKAIESKIRQRHKKYYSIPTSTHIDTTIELTPKFLETRNLIKQGIIDQFLYPHNLESCIHFLELGYQNLVEIVSENYFEFSKDHISSRDLTLYQELRNLIDVTAFQIVRAYLSIEDPITALKKHAAHISNVTSITRGRIESGQWIAVQYEWLAELLEMVPKSILTEANIRVYSKKHKNSKITRYAGGVRFHDDNVDVLLDPGLLYLKCSSYLTGVSETTQLDYLRIYKDSEELISKRKILLHKALQNVSIEGNAKYICFLLAGEYFSSGEWELSAEHFEKALGGWKSTDNLIKSKLIECYQELNAPHKSLELLLLLNNGTGNHEVDVSAIDGDIDVNCHLFDVDILFADEKRCSGVTEDVTVFDNIVCQLSLRPKVNIDAIKNHIKGKVVEILFKITDVEVNFQNEDSKELTGLSNIKVFHDSSIKDTVLQKPEDTKANLSFVSNHQKVLEVSQSVQKSGVYQLKTVKLKSVLEIKVDSKTLVIRNSESITPTRQPSYNWYFKKLDDSLIKVPVKISSSFRAHQIRVLPIRPNVVVTMRPPQINFITLGERVTLTFDVQFQNERKLNYNKISLSPRVKVTSNSDAGDLVLVDPKVNWDGLKDDEALVLQELDKTDAVTVKMNLAIHSTSLHAEEELKKSNNSYQAVLDLKTIVAEEGEQETNDTESSALAVYDTATYILPIVNVPFNCRVSIAPRFRDTKDGVNDMPNPFIMHGSNHLSMPIVTRLWQAKLMLNEPSEDIEATNIEFQVKSQNSEILVDLLPKVGNVSKTQTFATRSKNGVSHRNVMMVVSAKIDWRRKGSDQSNVFSTDEWEIVLPLSDPRMLLKVEKLKNEEKTVKLKYIIENPTPRIFIFSSKLVDDNERFIWNFDDERNMYPLVQTKFPVLPFNRFQLEYYGQFNSSESVIQMPQLKVFDIQYKVSLPALPVADDVITRDGLLMWRRQ
ncbi:hypothetical protein PSN45_003540 [Yamadazyma tenuis]|uniref:uncharacterized protein n=1 Tax=Candida tenuis TaxID=2315449 RepID=UPI0027A0067C|nr:hypothetical protein PSN45_003540 [Yamadazyma tenuis]